MGSKTTQSSQAVTIPPEVLARYNSVNATAEKAAKTPFQTYGGEFVAPVNAQQSQGIAGINAAANQSQPTYQQAIAGTQAAYYGAQPYNQGATAYALGAGQNVDPSQVNGAAINQFMSPYLQNVAGSEANLLNQNNQQAMAGQLGNAITSGAFGGDRAGIAAANLNQQNQLANANIYSNILNTGYNQALGAAQQQQGVNLGAQQANRAAYGNAAQLLQGIGQQQYGQGLGAAQQTAALGQGAQESALQGAQAQIGAGTLQQQTAQAGDTARYNQFLQQQSYPFQTAQFLANIAEGTGALSGSTTTTNQPGGFFGSDERLKENIEPIGMTFDGQTIHKYNYKGDDKRKQFGLIAQEVERHHPEAVGLAGGYKTVDYDKATPFTSSAATSEGGSVGLGHAGEGYAYGGPPTPPGVSSVDLQGILQAQSSMYAPYAGKSGLYGGSGGGPYGGTGHVPPPSGSVSHLAVASGLPAASNKTAMQSIHDTAQASKDMQEAWRGKKDAKGNVEQYGLRDLFSKKPPAADSAAAPAAAPAADPAVQTGLNVGSGAHGELTSGDMATGAAQRDASMSGLSAAQPEVAADNYTPSTEDFQGFAARGGLIQHHFADGGAMPYQDSGGGLDIPEVTPQQHSLQAPSSGLTAPKSGMSDVMDVAKIAAMFAARGGAVHREGHAYGGVPGANPAIPGFGASGGGAPSTGGAKGMIGGAPSTGGAKGMTTGPMHPAIQHALDTLHRADGGRIHKAVAGGVDANGNPIDPTTPDAQPSFLQDLGSKFRHPIDTMTNAPHVIGEGLNNLFSSPAGATGGLGQAAPSSASTERPRLPNGQEDLRSDWSRFWDNGTSNYDAARAKQRHELVAADEDKINPVFGAGFLTPKPSKEEIAAAAAPKPAGLSPAPAAAAPAVAPKPAVAAPTPAGLNSSNVAVPKPAEKYEYGPSSFVVPPSKDYEGEGPPSPLAKPTGLAAGAPSNASPVQEDQQSGLLKKALLPHSPMGVAASGAPPPPTENFVSKALSFLKSKGEDGQNHWDSSKIIPLITGIAQMGITPTRSLGVAASAGVLAGTQAILPTQQAQADIAQTQSSIRGQDIENARLANAIPIESVDTDRGIVKLANGKFIGLGQWIAAGRPSTWGTSESIAAQSRLPAGQVVGAPTFNPPSSVSVQPSASNGRPTPSSEAMGQIKLDSQTYLAGPLSGNLASQKDTANSSRKFEEGIANDASIARTTGTQLSTMAGAISGIDDDSFLNSGPLSPWKTSAINYFNDIVRSGGHPELVASQQDITNNQIANKISKALEFGITSQNQQNSLQALLEAQSGTPSTRMDRHTALSLISSLMVEKQRAIEKEMYVRDAKNMSLDKYNFDSHWAERQFRTRDGTDRKYLAEKDKLTEVLADSKFTHGVLNGTLSQDAIQAWEHDHNAPGITRYITQMSN